MPFQSSSAPADFTYSAEVLNFRASSSHTLEVAIVDDAILEATESFTLTLARAAVIPRFTVTPAVATVSIVDNESKFQCLSLQLVRDAV